MESAPEIRPKEEPARDLIPITDPELIAKMDKIA